MDLRLIATRAALQRIESLVFTEELPSTQSLSINDYDDLLDARDANEFASPWTKAYNAVSIPYAKAGIAQAEKDRVDKIREQIYKRVYKGTEVSDLASYVPDDFDLILRCLVTNTKSNWVNALWLSYKKGDVPRGNLTEVLGELNELIVS